MIRHDALRLLLLCGAHPPDTPESPGSDALPGSNTALSSWQSRHLISGAPILQSTPCSLSWPSSCALTFALLAFDRRGTPLLAPSWQQGHGYLSRLALQFGPPLDLTPMSL